MGGGGGGSGGGALEGNVKLQQAACRYWGSGGVAILPAGPGTRSPGSQARLLPITVVLREHGLKRAQPKWFSGF